MEDNEPPSLASSRVAGGRLFLGGLSSSELEGLRAARRLTGEPSSWSGGVCKPVALLACEAGCWVLLKALYCAFTRIVGGCGSGCTVQENTGSNLWMSHCSWESTMRSLLMDQHARPQTASVILSYPRYTTSLGKVPSSCTP